MLPTRGVLLPVVDVSFAEVAGAVARRTASSVVNGSTIPRLTFQTLLLAFVWLCPRIDVLALSNKIHPCILLGVEF